ncbi:alanine racemase, partial [Acinetobacter baumannii]
MIVANLSAVRNRLPSGTEVALVAKADAYGHGLVPVSRAA